MDKYQIFGVQWNPKTVQSQMCMNMLISDLKLNIRRISNEETVNHFIVLCRSKYLEAFGVDEHESFYILPHLCMHLVWTQHLNRLTIIQVLSDKFSIYPFFTGPPTLSRFSVLCAFWSTLCLLLIFIFSFL